MSIYANNILDSRYKNTSTSLIYDMVASKSKVLDIGCSTGNLAKVLIDNKQCSVDGIEIDPIDAAKARKVCGVVLEKDVNSYKFDDFKAGSYDFIILCNVLEHLTTPDAALKNCKKLLKKNGKILFSVPNIANITTRIDLLFGSFDYEDEGILDKTHYQYFTQKNILNLFADSGYGVTSYKGSTKEIEEKVLTDRLKTAGIKMTPKLKKLLYSEQALVYEHIGAARADGNPTKRPNAIANKIERLQHDYIDKLENGIGEAREYIQKLEKDNQLLHEEGLHLKALMDTKSSQEIRTEKLHLQNIIKKIKESLLKR